MTKKATSSSDLIKQIAGQAPHLVVIDESLAGMENGIMSFDIRVYQGKVRDVVVKTVKRVIIKP